MDSDLKPHTLESVISVIENAHHIKRHVEFRYHFIAPFYDVFLARLTAGSRQRSLSRLPQQGA
ncbi:MAG: hypothetical protein B7Y72_05965, partial [Mehylophilales bacterium 35-46-6]